METIREHIERQASPAKWIGIVAGVLLIPVAAGMRDPGSKIREHYVAAFTMVFLPVFLIAILFMTLLTRSINCPKCKKSLGWSALRMSDRGQRVKRIDACPNCGVDLDEPMPTKVISKQR